MTLALKKAIHMVAFIVTIIVIIFGVIGINTDEATGTAEVSKDAHTSEAIEAMRIAAKRNGIDLSSDDWLILLSINIAEGNVPGREFGIMNPEANTLDKQAGWCAASIVKSRARWNKAGKPGDFITFMGARYCPPDDHPLNKNWVGNVTYWFNAYKEAKTIEITKIKE